MNPEEKEVQEDFQGWFESEMAREEDPPEETPEDTPEATPEEPEESQEEQPEETPEESESDTEPPTSEETETFTVKVGDKEESIPLDELVKGYHRQSDYTRKVQELAEERKKLEAERQELASAQQQQSESLLSVKEDMAKRAGVLPKEEIDKLYDDDPHQWAVEREKRRAFDEQFDAQKEQSLKGQETVLREQVRQCWEKIPDVVPEWKDLDAAKTEIQEVARYIAGFGIPDTQVATIAEPLIWHVARKAMLYDKVDKPTIKKKVAEAPKMVKSGPPKSDSVSQSERSKKAAARLKKTGQGFGDWLMESGNV